MTAKEESLHFFFRKWNIAPFFRANEKFSSRSFCPNEKWKIEWMALALSTRHVYTALTWDTTYTATDTVFILSRVCCRMWDHHSYLADPPLSLSLSLFARGICACIPSLRRQLSRRQGSPVAARFVSRSLAAFLKSSKPFRRYGTHYWLMGLTQTVCMIGWDPEPEILVYRRVFYVGNRKRQCRDHA